VNTLRDSLNDMEKRDDLAARTRSATSFALPYGYLTAMGSTER
jgi:hypothetical protein